MPIAFTGHGSTVSRNGQTGAASPNASLQSGVRNVGDFMLGFVVYDPQNGALTAGTDGGVGAGNWTLIGDYTGQAGTSVKAFWRIATTPSSGGGTADDLSWTSGVSSTQGVVVAYSGVEPSVLGLNAFSGQSGSSTVATAPDITTTVDNTMIVRTLASQFGSVTFQPTTPSNPTKRNSNPGSGSYKSIGVFDLAQAAAGSTGTVSATMGTTYPWSGITIALRGPIPLTPYVPAIML